MKTTAQLLELIENALRNVHYPAHPAGLYEPIAYVLEEGGKRIRPILCMKFCEAAGGSMEEALDFGCAVEMLHTYSLIHDDLPAMDNDTLRRGRPTCHVVYGEEKKLFSFRIPEPSLRKLGAVTEAYVLTQLERGFRTFDFYKQFSLQETEL